MNLRTALVALGVIFGLTVGASTAQAAKGVKKKNNNGEHRHHGVVVAVDLKKGHFTIKSHHHSKKKKGANAGMGTKTFRVSSTTKYVFGGKKNNNGGAASHAHLRVGEHVSVASHNDLADLVVIHKHTKGKKRRK